MELDLVAQLITSIATFLVAVILLQQLFKQNKELNLQHKDSERDHMFQRFVSFQSIAVEITRTKETADIWVKGANNWKNLIEDSEKLIFRNLYNIACNMMMNNWEKSSPTERVNAAKMCITTEGLATVYKYYQRRPIYNHSSDMGKLWDKIYEETWGESLDNFDKEKVIPYGKFHDEVKDS